MGENMKQKIKNLIKRKSASAKKGRFFVDEKHKSENASDKILKAARSIFSKYPYNAATTRMIAGEADVDHPLIYYYFGSKEKLFEAVTEQMYLDFERVNPTWFDGMNRMTPKAGFSLFLDRLLDYSFANPEAFQLILINLTQIGSLDEIPGHQFIVKRLNRDIEIFEEKFPPQKNRSELEKFIHCFNSLVISFMGAKTCQAQLLNLDPNGPEYRKYIKDALYALFLPWLEKFFSPSTQQEPKRKE